MSKLFGMACEHAPTLGLFEHSCRRLLKQYMIRTTYCNPFRIAALTNRLSKQRTIATSKLNYKLQAYTHTHRMVERGRRALCTRACRSSTWSSFRRSSLRGTRGLTESFWLEPAITISITIIRISSDAYHYHYHS